MIQSPTTGPLDAAPAPAPAADLERPELYINRELSWLEFNRRVLREATDPRTPLLERLKFLGIFASNLDEFFQVRVAGLRKQVAARFHEPAADGLTPQEQLAAIAAAVRELLRAYDDCLLRDVLPGLATAGVDLVTDWNRLTDADRTFLAHYYAERVFPVLTPLAVDPAHPFPYISNLSVSLAVVLRGWDGDERFARVKVPKILPRWVELPGRHRFIPLELVISSHLESLFPNIEVLGTYPFRITRNTDLEIDPEEAEDLLSFIQEEVRNRRYAEVVRLEVHPATPERCLPRSAPRSAFRPPLSAGGGRRRW